MANKFRFSKGDRVDFDRSGIANDTPGTILRRVHTGSEPLYAVKWDDGNADNETYHEFELTPYVDTVTDARPEGTYVDELTPIPALSTNARPGSTYVVCNRRLDAETNEYCEFDGHVILKANNTWTCPGCHTTVHHSGA